MQKQLIFLRILLPILLIIIVLNLNGCGSSTSANNTSNTSPQIESIPDLDQDFSNQTMLEAFNSLSTTIALEYPFTQWKNIDWNVLYQEYEPQIESAMATNNQQLYYTLLRQYLLSVPDGHVGIVNSTYDQILYNQYFGASYGIELALNNNNQVIIVKITNSALTNTLSVGDIVTDWNNITIDQALESLDITWRSGSGGTRGIATNTYNLLERLDLITRGPESSSVNITVMSPSAESEQSYTLEAIINDKARGNTSPFLVQHAPTEYPIVTKSITNGNLTYEYINLGIIYPLESAPGTAYPNGGQETYSQFQQALTNANIQHSNGVIVDLRGNIGGSDTATANLLGFFFNYPKFYEQPTYFFPSDNMTRPITYANSDIPWIISTTPNQPYYSGCVVALVSPGTISSGEGFADFLGQALHGNVVGFYGTYGSFGIDGGDFAMPGGTLLTFTAGASLDQTGQIQIDSNNSGIGGALPTQAVPNTSENLINYFAGTDVELKFAESVINQCNKQAGLTN